MSAETDDDRPMLEAMGAWLRGVAGDVTALLPIADCTEAPLSVREPIVVALNYALEVTELLPEGVEGLGQLDRAALLRVACERAAEGDLSALSEDSAGVVRRLAQEAQMLRRFLDGLYPRVEQHLDNQRAQASEGRQIAQLLDDAQLRQRWAAELSQFVATLHVPAMPQEARVLSMQRAFFAARLPK